MAAISSANLNQLDDYENKTRPVALRVVALANRLTQIVITTNLIRPLRDAPLRAVANIPTMCSRFSGWLPGLTNEK